jgi:hypothetical protein
MSYWSIKAMQIHNYRSNSCLSFLIRACSEVSIPLALRFQKGYDHSYFLGDFHPRPFEVGTRDFVSQETGGFPSHLG